MFNKESRLERQAAEAAEAERQRQAEARDEQAHESARQERIAEWTNMSAAELYHEAADSLEQAERHGNVGLETDYDRVTAMATMAIYAKLREQEAPQV